MADSKRIKRPITPEDMESLRDLQAKLDTSAQDAAHNGNLYMHSLYVELLALVSKRVLKVTARRSRDLLADHRKTGAEIRTNPQLVSDSGRS